MAKNSPRDICSALLLLPLPYLPLPETKFLTLFTAPEKKLLIPVVTFLAPFTAVFAAFLALSTTLFAKFLALLYVLFAKFLAPVYTVFAAFLALLATVFAAFLAPDKRLLDLVLDLVFVFLLLLLLKRFLAASLILFPIFCIMLCRPLLAPEFVEPSATVPLSVGIYEADDG